MAHVGAVGKVIAPVFTGKKLIKKGSFIGSAPRSIEFNLIGITIALKASANFVESLLPA